MSEFESHLNQPWRDEEYTNKPAEPCRHCHVAPTVGRRGDVFAILCENPKCKTRPNLYSRDEQRARGRWRLMNGDRTMFGDSHE